MRLAIEAGKVSFRMGGALDNFLPFEHFPKTDPQRQAVAGLRVVLEQPHALIQFPAEAQCQRTSHSAESAIFGAKPFEGHSDLVIKQDYVCANPSALRTVQVTSMKTFPRMKKVNAQVAGPSGAQAVTLTPSAAALQP